MNYPTSIFRYFRPLASKRFLLAFSAFSLTAGGIVWACGGGDFDDDYYSAFSPEAFVDKAYTPFFYIGWVNYYGQDVNDNSNTRYNETILKEWNGYLNLAADQQLLSPLLFKTTAAGLDSVSAAYSGSRQNGAALAAALKTAGTDQKKTAAFLQYLQLAKACESFAASDMEYDWETPKKKDAPSAALATELTKAFQQGKDEFIRQRLWFQLVRLAYFNQSAGVQQARGPAAIFEQYAAQFPKNSTWYRALGYVAGASYLQKDYARANYLYSLCYDFSSTMKIPSKWSFHPQNEQDWQQCLQLAKNDHERITLWQMLGISADGKRALEQIYAIDPKSEKLDLLLSRLVNQTEAGLSPDFAVGPVENKKETAELTALVGNIARKNNTAKPYFWNLAAGYLNSLSGNYKLSQGFYDKAGKQLPAGDRLVNAQYRLLDWMLYVSRLEKIDAATEQQMAARVSWLAGLGEDKTSIKDLRFEHAMREVTKKIAAIYQRQGDLLKANCFVVDHAFFHDTAHIEAARALFQKKDKTPFEQAMLRYFPLSEADLNLQQGLMEFYAGKTESAAAMIAKSDAAAKVVLPGNPFNGRLNDCHDCDHDAPQQKKFTRLSFVETVNTIKIALAMGKDKYRNALLLANAYYNATYYGNARVFYEGNLTLDNYGSRVADAYTEPLASGKMAEKYYLLALSYATTKEQQARCTFMAAKCERNDLYNKAYADLKAGRVKDFAYENAEPAGKYFASLKNNYRETRFFREALEECGYFSRYARR